MAPVVGHEILRVARLRTLSEPDIPEQNRAETGQGGRGWGLAKLGDRDAYRYLVEMFWDPDIETATRYRAGESFRAAQAICDLKAWPFEWNREAVGETRRKITESGEWENMSAVTGRFQRFLRKFR